MKPNIHPQKYQVEAQCVCTNKFHFSSALNNEVIHIEVCNKCHPFYTKKQQIISTAGRVDNFNSKFANFQDKTRQALAAVTEAKSIKNKKTTKSKLIKVNKDKAN